LSTCPIPRSASPSIRCYAIPHDVSGVIDRKLRPHRQGLLPNTINGSTTSGPLATPPRLRWWGAAARSGTRDGEFRARPGHRGRATHREARRQGTGLRQTSARHLRFCFAAATAQNSRPR
jgi:hypothetical protein